MLNRVGRLPAPQRDALQIAFGMSAGSAPNRFLIGLAVLGLLSDVAEQRPLLCLIDNEQWLDRASAQILAFVARRLGSESVGLVFSVRVPGDELARLPELAVAGLSDTDARLLLDSALTAPLDARIRDLIVAEAHGSPLALLELPRGLTAEELAGGFGFPGAVLSLGSVEDSFRQRRDALPAETRRLLVLATASPAGNAAVVWRAARRLGISDEAAAPAAEAGLAEFGSRVRFRHPLVRSMIYQSASPAERREAHRALAEVTDGAADADRRAWHLAEAARGPDEAVAGELERSAGRARARGGLAAAAAFLERAATLTPEPARRAERALAAADTKFRVGAFEAAVDLLAMAEAGPLSELQRASVDFLRARFALATNRGSDAAPLLLKAAKRLEPIDAGLSRAAYLDAMSAAMFAGRLARPGGGMREAALAASTAPRPVHAPRAPDLLLDGLVALANEEYAAAVPILRRALASYGVGMSTDDELRWMWVACVAAMHIWDDDLWVALARRYVELARKAGALSELPYALTMRAYQLVLTGDLASAGPLIDEIRATVDATEINLTAFAAILTLVAGRGGEAEASALIEATTTDVTARGEGIGITCAELATALLNNGLGRYREAMSAAERAVGHEGDLVVANWALVELIEAAARDGKSEAAAGALRRVTEIAAADGTDWAVGVAARSRALLAEGEAAERLYLDSITHLGRTRVRGELARAHLLYGEWLRRQGRRADAREQLRTAHGMLETMGMAAFAERAGHELRATGATARKRTVVTTPELTAQETLIALLARDGLSNPAIGARLFISARTVQYHLGKVFAKLDITSRSQLDRALPGRPPTA